MYILDGAMGTMIQSAHPNELNYDLLCLKLPRLIVEIHLAYLEAGADIISTNSFNANRISQPEHGLVRKINRAAARLAREASTHFTQTHPHRKCYVAGSMGPTNKSASLSHNVDDLTVRSITFAQLVEVYREQAEALLDGGVDILLIETVFDTLNAKAALFAIEDLLRARSLFGSFPVMLSATLSDSSGRTLSGQSIEAFVSSVSHFPLWSIGLNCSFGADQLTPYIRRLSKIAPCKVSAHPNAGLPDLYGNYTDSPKQMAQKLLPYIEENLVDILGGCCGTTPEHIAAISQIVKNHHIIHNIATVSPLPTAPPQTPHFSGLDLLSLQPHPHLTLIGERTNVCGSQKFARLIREEQYDAALEIAREMVHAGAHIIDINMDHPLLNAPQSMVRFLNLLSADPEIARLPVMLDSSNWEVLEAGLACLQGKSLVNSISLKEGEALFKERAAKIHQYGAAVVVMAFDEEGQATTLDRRIEICTRAYRILTQELDWPPYNIIFDPNVLTIGTGMEEHRSYAIDFIDAVRYIKLHLPGALTSGGVSNLSFAFRGNNTIREAIHSVFLYHAVKAGLDMAIVNPSTMIPYTEIPDALKEAVEDMVLNRNGRDAMPCVLAANGITTAITDGITNVGRDAMPCVLAANGITTATTDGITNVGRDAMHCVLATDSSANGRKDARHCVSTVPQRISQSVVQGDPMWIAQDIDDAMAMGYHPVTIIEELLMEGMNRVGKLFGTGKMFLPQVIKSARVMKQAVTILQPWLQGKEATDSIHRHTGIIATVKGDVHDIGKNIAAVVMECNHYTLIDLGVMVPAEQIVQAAIEHQADFVGLSGLITPSLEEMCIVAEAMERAGLKIPLLIGGATTSKEYIALRMAQKYSGLLLHCPDASANVRYLSRWFSAEQREAFQREVEKEYAEIRSKEARGLADGSQTVTIEEARAGKEVCNFSFAPLSIPTWLGVKDMDIPVRELRSLINWNALYALWEVHKSVNHEALLQQQKHLQIDAGSMIDRFTTGEWGQIRAAVGFFPANSDGQECIELYADESRREVIYPFKMPRQQQRQSQGMAHFCLADFVAPASSLIKDYIGLFAINASPLGVEQQINIWQTQGDGYRSILLRSLCDRLAEAASVWLHRKVQTEWWGYGADKGIRPAFGYPSCPDHAPKADVLRLLEANSRIDLTLTERYMLQPVSAICGLYFAHPQAHYFSV